MDRWLESQTLAEEENGFLSENKRALMMEWIGGERVLEVGCGTGKLAADILKSGRGTWAIDISNTAIGISKRDSPRGIRFILGDINKSSLPKDYFDTIVSMEVLEHIRNDISALESMRRLLKSGGKLVGTVPAFMLLWSPHDKNVGHYRRYTPAMLRRKLRAAGFTLERYRFYNLTGVPLMLYCRLTRSEYPLADISRSSLSKFLKKMLCIERKIALPFGVSLCFTAKKA